MSGATAGIEPRATPAAPRGPLAALTPGRLPARADVLAALVAAVGSLIAAGFSLQLWKAHLHVPLVYGSDGLFSLAQIKWIIDGGGWVFTNHQVGYPHGLELFDYPLSTDNLNYVGMWLLGLFTSDPSKVMNVWFLGTFPAEAISGFAVMRWIGASRPSAVVAAILFADCPYHLLRGETHLLLSQYISVPLATYMILSILRGRRVLTGSLRPFDPRSFLAGRNLFMLALCVVVGSCGVYYAVFAIMLLIAAGLAAGVRDRRWTAILEAATLIVAIGAIVFVNDLPTAVYRHEHGTDHLVAHRLPQESEIYALKLAEMVLPVPEHRIGALARIRNKYDTTNPVPSEDGQQSLGIVGVLGLVWMFLIALGAVVGVSRGRDPTLRRRQAELGFAALVAFLIGTLGGISALIGYLISPQIRGYDRISIFIEFFALATVALSLDLIGRRYLRGRRMWAMLALAGVLCIGVFDSSTRLAIPDYQAVSASFGSDRAFVDQIQQTLPPGSAVFQLPYMPFPEVPPIVDMQDYDPLRAYVQSTDLDWSYPVMAGRNADIDSQLWSLPPQTLLDSIVSIGFRGLWIDHAGYADGGAEVIDAVQSLTGEAPLNSRDGRFSFFDLRPWAAAMSARVPLAARTALRSASLNPPFVSWENGFYAPEGDGSRWALDDAPVTVVNHARATRRAVFFANVQTLASGRFTLSVDRPGAPPLHFTIGPRPRVVTFTFTMKPGANTIAFSSNAPTVEAPGDPRQLAVHFGLPAITAAGAAPFLPGQRYALAGRDQS